MLSYKLQATRLSIIIGYYYFKITYDFNKMLYKYWN